MGLWKSTEKYCRIQTKVRTLLQSVLQFPIQSLTKGLKIVPPLEILSHLKIFLKSFDPH